MAPSESQLTLPEQGGVSDSPEPFAPKQRRSGWAVKGDHLVKDYGHGKKRKRVLDHVSFDVAHGERLAILGRNGSGKSTLIRIIAGVERQSAGQLTRTVSMSWPIALGGGFEGGMTGYDAVRFISTIYDCPFQEMLDYVNDFSELGAQLFEQIKFYSAGMRARLAFGLSLAVDFECFLIDEVILVGDQRFQAKCFDALFNRVASRILIVAIHDMGFVREHCDSALVLHRGQGRQFQDVVMATDIYATL